MNQRLSLALAAASLLLAAALAPGHGAATPSGPPPPPERYTLDNELSVVLDPLPRRHTVAVVVSVEAGHRDQPPGWTGLAHLTEHLLFEGTEAAPGDYITRLERLGVSAINGETSRDWTRYYEVVPSARLERTLWLEAERFAHGLDGLEEENVDRQRQVLDRERELRDFGREQVWELVNSILYPAGHPYANAREVRDDVHAAHLAQVRWFAQRYYQPDRMTLALSGGFDADEARAWIERYFGPLRRGPIEAAPRPRPPAPISIGVERRVLAEAPRSDDLLCAIYPTPAWGAEGDAELDLIARELDARLSRRLLNGGDSLDVFVTQHSGHLASSFRACVEVRRRSGTLAPLQALDAEIANLRTHGIDEARVASLREQWVRREVLQHESSLARALRFAQRPPAFDGERVDLPASLARYRSVDAEGVLATIRRWLPQDSRLVVSIAGRLDAPREGRIVSDVDVQRVQ